MISFENIKKLLCSKTYLYISTFAMIVMLFWAAIELFRNYRLEEQQVELSQDMLGRDNELRVVKRQARLIAQLCARTNACTFNLQTNEIEIKQ